MKLRRKARMAVLQALYEVDVANHPAGEALDRRLQEQPLPAPAEDFARQSHGGRAGAPATAQRSDRGTRG